MCSLVILIFYLYDKLSHTGYNHNDDCGKSLEKQFNRLGNQQQHYIGSD